MTPSPTEEFLSLSPGDVLAFIGGGGKSTLIHSLAAKLAKEGRTVITTATRAFRPGPGESPYIFLTDERPLHDLRAILGEHGTLTVAPERGEDGELAGYPPEEVDTFADLADYLFVEAEDAGGASLPGPVPPGEVRPVPPVANVLCAVAGLDALGPDLDCAAFAERLVRPGGLLDPEALPGRTILFLNKADRRSVQEDGARICRALRPRLGRAASRVRIVLSSVRHALRRLE